MPCSGIVISCMILVMIAIVPTYRSPPYFCSPELSVMLTRLSVLCMMKGETPSAAICFTVSASGFI